MWDKPFTGYCTSTADSPGSDSTDILDFLKIESFMMDSGLPVSSVDDASPASMEAPKGITKCKSSGKYQAYAWIRDGAGKGKQYFLGSYESREDAMEARAFIVRDVSTRMSSEPVLPYGSECKAAGCADRILVMVKQSRAQVKERLASRAGASEVSEDMWDKPFTGYCTSTADSPGSDSTDILDFSKIESFMTDSGLPVSSVDDASPASMEAPKYGIRVMSSK
jgi:hypothetical protein